MQRSSDGALHVCELVTYYERNKLAITMVTILIFIAVLAVLVLAHEWGHFITARRAGCKVDEFGFGFPPRLWGWQRGETLYTINLLPLGGFVRIHGESGEDTHADPRSFQHKSAAARLLIVAAGVLMNLVVAVILFAIVAGVGIEREVPRDLPSYARVENREMRVLTVASDSVASRAGVVAGDVLRGVSGVATSTISVPVFQEALQDGVAHTLVIERAGAIQTITVTPAPLRSTPSRLGIGVVIVDAGTISYPWYLTPWIGVRDTWISLRDTVVGFGTLIHGLITRIPGAADGVSGPVGIAVFTGEIARSGFIPLLYLMGFLSVSLAFINVLPIPALDGGRMLFIVIEKLRRGRKVRANIENVVHGIGFLVLLAIIALVTYRDIIRLFRG